MLRGDLPGLRSGGGCDLCLPERQHHQGAQVQGHRLRRLVLHVCAVRLLSRGLRLLLLHRGQGKQRSLYVSIYRETLIEGDFDV